MADAKLSALIELAVAPASDDELYIRDVSEAAASESKRITIANLKTTTGKTATKVVAANDADATVKLQADYICDGTSDNVEIQAAIDSLTAGRTWIETVKCIGGFSITTRITLASYTRLDLTEAYIKIPDNFNANFQILYATAKTNIEVIGGVLDGNKANQSAGGQTSIYFSSLGSGAGATAIQGCLIKGVTVKNMRNDGITLISTVNSQVLGNIVRQSGGMGINISTATTKNLIISGNLVQGNNLRNIYVKHLEDSVISNNIAEGSVTQEGIILYSNCNGVIVSGNTCNNNAGEGINISTPANDYNTIVGNICRGNASHGIRLENADYNIISGNTCRGNLSGIHIVGDSNNNTIVGNTCTESGAYGISAIDTSGYNIYLGNKVRGNTTGAMSLVGANNLVRSNEGYVTENSGTATIGGGTLTNGTGIATGSPITLIPGANTPTITQAGTFVINLPAGNVGTAATGGWTVTGSPVALVAGNNTITVEAGGSGTITVTTATVLVTVTHGLATTPTRALTIPTSDPGAANAFWISAKGATTFVINAKVAVTTQTTFDWRAQVGEG